MSGWKEYKLKDITSKIGSGATPRGGQESYKDEGISLIRSQNVLDFQFSYNGLAYIDDEQAKNLVNVEVFKNDILLNITGDSVARVCMVPDKVLPARVNQHVSIVRAKADLVDPQYLLYYLLNPSFKKFMLKVASDGGTRNALTKSDIEDFNIKLPSLPEQQSIAAVLSSLDNKVDLLRRQNDTLGKIAQTLFKRWFVEFEFPFDFSQDRSSGSVQGELFDFAQSSPTEAGKPYKSSGGAMVASELGEIPAGWRVGALGEILQLNYGKGLKTEDRNNGDFLVVGSSGIIGRHNEYLVKAPGIVIGRKGTIGKVIWVDKHFFPIDTTFYVMDNLGVEDLFFHYFVLKKQKFNRLISDSAVPGLNRNLALSIEELIPDLALIKKFNQIAKPIFNKMCLNTNQIQTLTRLRDTLLPKLMSGQIRTTGISHKKRISA